MNKEEANVLQLLTGKTYLEEIGVDELQQLADEYPYFAAVQLLLAKKMQQAYHPQLQQQLYKTALYFPNEQWLRYLLKETENTKSDITNSLQPGNIIANSDTNTLTEELAAVNIPTADIFHNDAVTNTGIAETNTTKETEDANTITLPAADILEEFPLAKNIYDEPEEPPLDEDELQQQRELLHMEESNQKIATILSGQAEEFYKPIEKISDVPVAAEPFHTVDYFASQGIKFDAKKEENNLDKKVHKFTDWLRQMKRINPHPVDLGTEAADENYVANIADSSNYTKEIVTESMADVLLKQGKKEKAVEIYQKLGLLYPNKNTYFAALIQQIK